MPAVSRARFAASKSEKAASAAASTAVWMNRTRSDSSGSGTSMAATCGLPVSRSLRSASFSSSITNAMFSRLTCGLIAQFSIITSWEDACALRRPGSPDGNTYDA